MSNLYSQDIVLGRSIEGRMQLVQDCCSQVASPKSCRKMQKFQQQRQEYGSWKSTSKGPLYHIINPKFGRISIKQSRNDMAKRRARVPLESHRLSHACHNILFHEC